MKYTTLVNKDNPIKKSFIDRITLEKIENVDGKEVLIEEKTKTAYIKLKNYLETKNIFLGIDDAYRSIEEQEELYQIFLKKYGQEYVDNSVAVPMYSEHNTGMAIDINIKIEDKYLSTNEELLKQENTFKEIHENMHKFGFILRYPKEKENITGYKYEPWHIRYVGNPISEIIYNNNYTLEEYLENYSGIIVVNKEKNITSFDVVNKISNILGIKRIGHTGTLDPMAEGVLIITIGKATKIAELLTSEYKEYEASAVLGIETDTLDITGNIIDKKELTKVERLEEVINSYKKTYNQEVPIYSAIKVNGKKLYEYARSNKKIDLPTKEVTIKNITLISSGNKTFRFKCLVSKGCYIRSLIRDIGKSLDTLATMTSLTRTSQGKFSLKESCTLDDIENNKFKLLSITEVLDYPKIKVSTSLQKRIENGNKILNDFDIEDKVIFIDQSNNILGIYQKEEEYLKVWKNFV